MDGDNKPKVFAWRNNRASDKDGNEMWEAIIDWSPSIPNRRKSVQSDQPEQNRRSAVQK